MDEYFFHFGAKVVGKERRSRALYVHDDGAVLLRMYWLGIDLLILNLMFGLLQCTLSGLKDT